MYIYVHSHRGSGVGGGSHILDTPFILLLSCDLRWIILKYAYIICYICAPAGHLKIREAVSMAGPHPLPPWGAKMESRHRGSPILVMSSVICLKRVE